MKSPNLRPKQPNIRKNSTLSKRRMRNSKRNSLQCTIESASKRSNTVKPLKAGLLKVKMTCKKPRKKLLKIKKIS
jgi:hypothetical protein